MNTAMMSAFVRMYHKKVKKGLVYNEVNTLMNDEEYNQILGRLKQVENYDYFISNNLSPIVLSRSQFHFETLENAKMLGLNNYVMLGCGLMTVPVLDEKIRLIEVDFKETLEMRENRESNSFERVSLNLVDDSLKGLNLNGISFVSMLGVSYYLGFEVVEKILEELSYMLEKGSSIIFDYTNCNYDERYLYQMKLGGALGEKMLTGISYSDLEQLCNRTGYLIYDHLGHIEIKERYYKKYNEVYQSVEPFKNINLCLLVRDKD